MLEYEDLKWVATTTTELNTMLQQISRYADLSRQHKGEYNYIELLDEQVALASKTATALFDRVTSRILSGNAKTPPASKPGRPAPFTIVPPPAPSVAALHEVAAKMSAPEIPETRAPIAAVVESGVPIVNPNGARELLLLVDDEAQISELASAILTQQGYKMILASNGMEALKIYQKIGKKIDLVILDFFLPVMDGDAVFDELRMLNPDVNVVLSSGFAEQTKLGSMLARGLRGFIPKPYTGAKLLAQVRSALDAAPQPA